MRKPPDPDTILDVSTRLEAAIAATPALSQASPQEVIRIVPGKRAVLRGRLGDRTVIFRLFLTQGDATPALEWAEMTRAWPQMNAGHLRIAEPLHFVPAHGLVVIEDVPGTPLLQLLYQTDPAQRAQWLIPAADWLRRYTRASERTAAAQHRRWLDRARAAADSQPHASLRRAEAKVLAQLTRLAPAMDGHSWRVAVSHGDFHPNNLIAQAPRLTGIDTGGSASLPVYKDMARFLMHMGRRGMLPSGEARFGVDRQGITAFRDAFEMSEAEETLHLPYMLGCEALLRVESRAIKPGRVRRAAKMYEGLITDLERL